MNKGKKKTLAICIILIITSSMLFGCCINEENSINKKIESESVNINIDKENANVLKIGTIEFINSENSKDKNTNDTKTKVTNESNFNIRNIELMFREYDKENKAIAKTEALCKISLKPDESVYIQAAHKKNAQDIKVTGYSYNLGNKLIYVDLESKKVNISNINEKIIRDTKYNILAISKPEIINAVNGEYNSKLTIKNISDKDIGSVVLEIAELNDKEEYINIRYLDSYNVIKKSQEVKLDYAQSYNTKSLEVIGYIYDDIKDKKTVEVNLKLNEVILSK